MSRDAPLASAHHSGHAAAAGAAGSQRTALEIHHEFSWTLLHRGSFLFGRCDECGFVTPGRRARYSTEADMGAHAVICHANRTVDVTELRAEVQHSTEPAVFPG